MTHTQFFKFFHHLINPRLYTVQQIEQRNQTILVANWKRAELEHDSKKEANDNAEALPA